MVKQQTEWLDDFHQALFGALCSEHGMRLQLLVHNCLGHAQLLHASVYILIIVEYAD